jgi:hypothetical protein
MREIKLHLEHREQIEVPDQALIAAVGYLSTWNMNYPRVEIYNIDGTDLVANYYDKNGTHKYQIGAVWHKDHYGFHS